MMRIIPSMFVIGSMLIAAPASAGFFDRPIDIVTGFTSAYQIGHSYNGALEFGVKHLPLPPGDWTVLTLDAHTTNTTIEGGGTIFDSGAVGSIFLIQNAIGAKGPMRYLTIQGQLTGGKGSGWYSKFGLCKKIEQEYVYRQEIRNDWEDNQDCSMAWISAIKESDDNDKFDAELVNQTKLLSINLPQVFIAKTTVLTRASDMLQVTYAENLRNPPEKPDDIPSWMMVDWHKQTLTPAQSMFIERVGREADEYLTQIRAATKLGSTK